MTGSPSASGNWSGSLRTPFIWNSEALTLAISVNRRNKRYVSDLSSIWSCNDSDSHHIQAQLVLTHANNSREQNVYAKKSDSTEESAETFSEETRGDHYPSLYSISSKQDSWMDFWNSNIAIVGWMVNNRQLIVKQQPFIAIIDKRSRCGRWDINLNCHHLKTRIRSPIRRSSMPE